MALDDEDAECAPLLPKPSSTGPRSVLIWARVVTAVTSIAEGYCMGCFAGALIPLSEGLGLTHIQKGVISGTTYYGVTLGSLAGGISDIYGRKPALALSYVMLIVGGLLMGFAQDFVMLFIGRIVESMGIGLGLSIVTVYLSEVAPSSHRGMFSSMEETFLVGGMVLGSILDEWFLRLFYDWRYMLGCAAVLPALALPVLLATLPESPRYLFMKGRTDEAKAVLEQVTDHEEMSLIVASWKEQQTEMRPSSWADVLCPSDSNTKDAFIAACLVAMSQMMSAPSLMGMMMPEFFGTFMEHSTALKFVILVNVVRLIYTGLICTIIDDLGRRPLLLVSAGGCTISLGFLGLAGVASFPVGWHLAGTILYFLFFETGLGPVTYVFVGEVLDTKMRSKGLSIALFFSRGFMGTVLLVFPLMHTQLSMGVFLFVICALNVILFPLLWARVPETKGMVLEKMPTHVSEFLRQNTAPARATWAYSPMAQKVARRQYTQ
mmetsp:Transcript_115114/g.245990  ORF Transcript_115114/g.245990 Transcript_115114/m.245990 type:complete len:491 (+) Transcript_115114:68-1540(+)